MIDIWFSQEAVGGMLSSCYRTGSRNEFGGTMVGLKNIKGTVTDIIQSTRFAATSPTSYFQTTKDVKIQNNKLNAHQQQGRDFVGYYHKHPYGMNLLSSGDANTCREILNCPNYIIDNYLIMCIITESHSHPFPLFTYVASLNQANKVIIKPVQYGILPKKALIELAQPPEAQDKEIEHEDHDLGQHR